MKIAIASDHGGFELKERLKDYFASKSIVLTDLGTNSPDSVDYPDFAKKMARHILGGQADLGILICGTGIGISIAANRFKGIRAALLYSPFASEMAKKHNNANVVVFGGRTMSFKDVVSNLEIFLNASFEGGRHLNRINKIDEE
jgi:ribose 5-phosphate isomerase B